MRLEAEQKAREQGEDESKVREEPELKFRLKVERKARQGEDAQRKAREVTEPGSLEGLSGSWEKLRSLQLHLLSKDSGIVNLPVFVKQHLLSKERGLEKTKEAMQQDQPTCNLS